MSILKAVKGKATCADIARLAGVSKSTVSLVLNNHPNVRVSVETRKRIYDAIKELDYSPNAIAKALSTGRTNSIGILIFHVGTPFTFYTAEILGGVWEAIRSNSMRMTIDAIDAFGDISHFQREAMVDGIITIAPPTSVAGIDAVIESGIPLLCVGSKVFGRDISYVDLNNYEVARKSVESLIRMGHRDILHITGPVDEISSANDRLNGYKAALAAAGIPFRASLVLPGTYLPDSGCKAIKGALAGNIRFSAVFAANSGIASGAVSELIANGFKIPEDISVIGIDADCPLLLPELQLTTISQPLKEIGRTAGKLLLQKLEGKKQKTQSVLLDGEFIEGNTVAPRK